MLRLITAPTERPVTLEMIKLHVMANDFSDDDGRLAIYLDNAIAYVSKQCSRVLAPSLYRVERQNWWRNSLEVLVAPVRDVVSVKYFDVDGAEQTLSESAYHWSRTESGACVELVSSLELPGLSDRKDAIRIDIEAGYDIDGETGSGDDPELSFPRPLRQAVLMLAAYWYEKRETAADDNTKAVPFGVTEMINMEMIFR